MLMFSAHSARTDPIDVRWSRWSSTRTGVQLGGIEGAARDEPSSSPRLT